MKIIYLLKTWFILFLLCVCFQSNAYAQNYDLSKGGVTIQGGLTDLPCDNCETSCEDGGLVGPPDPTTGEQAMCSTDGVIYAISLLSFGALLVMNDKRRRLA